MWSPATNPAGAASFYIMLYEKPPSISHITDRDIRASGTCYFNSSNQLITP